MYQEMCRALGKDIEPIFGPERKGDIKTQQHGKDTLSDWTDDDFYISSISEIDGLPYVIRSMHTMPEDKSRQMPVYHLVLHLCDVERKRVAREARGKNNKTQ